MKLELIEITPLRLCDFRPVMRAWEDHATGTMYCTCEVPVIPRHRRARLYFHHETDYRLVMPACTCCSSIEDRVYLLRRLRALNSFLKLTVLQNKSRKFNEWLFDPDHYAGKWHKKNMLRDFQDS